MRNSRMSSRRRYAGRPPLPRHFGRGPRPESRLPAAERICDADFRLRPSNLPWPQSRADRPGRRRKPSRAQSRCPPRALDRRYCSKVSALASDLSGDVQVGNPGAQLRLRACGCSGKRAGAIDDRCCAGRVHDPAMLASSTHAGRSPVRDTRLRERSAWRGSRPERIGVHPSVHPQPTKRPVRGTQTTATVYSMSPRASLERVTPRRPVGHARTEGRYQIFSDLARAGLAAQRRLPGNSEGERPYIWRNGAEATMAGEPEVQAERGQVVILREEVQRPREP